MNIDDYRYITTIADLGSFTSAAKELFIAQPSLSQRVKHIENEYGIIIFIRDSKTGIHLTEDGECFVRYAQQILQSDADLRKELSDLHGTQSNILRIGTSQLINSYLFDQLILRFHDQHPEVRFDFVQRTSPELQELLIGGKIDVAICYLPITSPHLKYETIFDDRFVLVPSIDSALEKKIQTANIPPYGSVNLHILDGEPFAIAPPGSRMSQYVTSTLDESGCKPDIQHVSKNFSTLYSIARAGIASTLLYESFFNPSEEHIPYYYLDDGANSDLSIAIAWRKNAYLHQSLKDLIEIAHRIG